VLAITVISLLTLTAFHHQPYDMLILTLPCVAFLGRRFPDPFYEPGIYVPLLGLLAIPAFNYLATFSGVGALGLTGLPYLVVTSVNGIALLGAFFLVVSTTIAARGRLRAASSSGRRHATPDGVT